MPSRFPSGTLTDGDQEVEPVEPALLAICTSSDDTASRLRAGEALGAILLKGTADGFAMVPLSQAIEVDQTRRLLQDELLRDSACPQIVIQVGWSPVAAEQIPPTPRRRCRRRARRRLVTATLDWALPRLVPTPMGTENLLCGMHRAGRTDRYRRFVAPSFPPAHTPSAALVIWSSTGGPSDEDDRVDLATFDGCRNTRRCWCLLLEPRSVRRRLGTGGNRRRFEAMATGRRSADGHRGVGVGRASRVVCLWPEVSVGSRGGRADRPCLETGIAMRTRPSGCCRVCSSDPGFEGRGSPMRSFVRRSSSLNAKVP